MNVAKNQFLSERSRSRGSAFTLMELLAVIAIIVVMLGLGMVAFNALTGRRSTAMARNQVAAMLSKARAIAINDKTTQPLSYGVIFFRDPKNDRTAMAIARRTDNGGGDPDPHDNYKGWLPGVTYHPGDRVVAIVRDDVEGGTATAVRFRCSLPATGQNNRPPAYRPMGTTPPLKNNYWEEVIDAAIGFPDEPIEFLPAGVGVQLMIEPIVSGGLVHDRYVRTGAVFFDRRGQLDHLSFRIPFDSPVGLNMGLGADLPYGVGTLMYSAIGMAIYDDEAFRSAGHTDADFTSLLRLSGAPTSQAVEASEEQWLDENASKVLINRYSGELSSVQ